MSKFQPENTAGLKNGSRTRRNGIALAALAKRHGAISVDLRRLKRTLDPYVQHRQGAERLKAVAAVNEICRWEMSARIMQKTLATETLSPELTLSYLNSISNCTRQRNSLLTKLLGKGAAAADDPWAVLDEPLLPSSVACGNAGQQVGQQDEQQAVGQGVASDSVIANVPPDRNSTEKPPYRNSGGNSTAVEILPEVSFGRGGE